MATLLQVFVQFFGSCGSVKPGGYDSCGPSSSSSGSGCPYPAVITVVVVKIEVERNPIRIALVIVITEFKLAYTALLDIYEVLWLVGA